jgi:acyl-ACP thioesterase
MSEHLLEYVNGITLLRCFNTFQNKKNKKLHQWLEGSFISHIFQVRYCIITVRDHSTEIMSWWSNMMCYPMFHEYQKYNAVADMISVWLLHNELVPE